MRNPGPLFVALLALAGCGQQTASEPEAKPRMPRMTDQDAFTKRVVTAMCGRPADRALAISVLAEQSATKGDDSDDIYLIGTEVAEKGCPSPG